MLLNNAVEVISLSNKAVQCERLSIVPLRLNYNSELFSTENKASSQLLSHRLVEYAVKSKQGS